MSTIAATIGKKLRLLRQRGALTQEELAERAEISVSYLSMLERGVRSPRLETLEKLCDALGLPLRELFR